MLTHLRLVTSLTAWHGMLDFPITQDSEHILHFIRMRKISTYSYHRVFAQQGPIRVSALCNSPRPHLLKLSVRVLLVQIIMAWSLPAGQMAASPGSTVRGRQLVQEKLCVPSFQKDKRVLLMRPYRELHNKHYTD
jgi:hypothetical protein